MAKWIVRRRLFLLLTAVPLAALPASSAPADPSGVVESAMGSGHMVRPDGTFRSFSFTAAERADGTVTGQVQLNSRSFDVFVHISVDCLRVVGNTAYMSGRITHSSDPEQGFIGELNRFAVQDNGEGPGAVDRISTIPENPGNADPKTCTDDMSDRPLARVVQRGNVQVRGG